MRSQLLPLPLVLLVFAPVPGCATFAANKTAQAFVAAGAAPAEDLAADALAAQLASLPTDPTEFHAWLIAGGLTDAEASTVTADVLADAQAELAGVARYVEDGAFGRLAVSALAGEAPAAVGHREAARYLLARATSQ